MAEEIESNRISYTSNLSSAQRELLEFVENGSLPEVEQRINDLSKVNLQEKWFDYVILTTALKSGHKPIAKFLLESNCRVKADSKTKFLCTPLYYAVELDDADIFGDLIKEGASIYDKDVNEKTSLEFAVQNGKFKLIDVMLCNRKSMQTSKGFDPESRNDLALFHMACYRRNLDAIKDFIESGFSVCSRSIFDQEYWRGFTPLHFTLSNTHRWSDCLADELLLKQDADLSTQDESGDTPVHIAFNNGNEKLLKMWVSRLMSQKFTNPQDKYGLSHFHIICCGSDDCDQIPTYVETAQHFIKNGVDINSPTSSVDPEFPSYTAFHFAVRNFRLQLVELLLNHGADLKKTNAKGLTPLHIACDYETSPDETSYSTDKPKVKRQDRVKIVSILLEHGATVDVKDVNGDTPLHYVFRGKIGNDPLTQLLLSKSHLGSNIINSHGLSYLHIASAMDLSAVKTLIEKGASVNSRVNSDSSFRSGYSPLHIAVEFNKFEIVHYLLDHGADPYMKVEDRFEDTPLHLASDCEIPSFHDLYESLLHTSGPNDAMQSYLKDRNRIIELLIKRGVPTNEKNLAGNTPLMVALTTPISFGSYMKDHVYVSEPEIKLLKQIYEGQRSTVALLLRRGADVHVRNNKGESVLHQTTDQGEIWHKKILTETMLKKGVDVNVVDGEGLCPLIYVMMSTLSKPSDMSLLRLFCKYGVNINARDCLRKNTPLHNVAENYDENESDHQKVIDLILYHPEIELNAVNDSGNTPLHIAAKEKTSDMPELMKEFGFSFRIEPTESKLNHSICVEKLLGAGANINVKNSAGLTPFHQLHKWLMDYSSRSDRYYTDMFIVVLTHLKKLMKMGISLDDEFLEKFNELLQIRPKVSVVLDRVLDQEVTKLKSKMIDPRTSLYDILLKDASGMAKYAKNGELRKIIESPKFTSDYLLFHGILIQQFNKGLVRSLILEPAKKALDVLLGVRLSPCAEYILELLDNEDMRNLIESIFDGKTWKRSTLSSFIFEECQVKIRQTPANQHWISFIEIAVGMHDILLRN